MRRNLDVAQDARGRYSTDLFTDQALNIINRHDHNKSSLFLYLSHLAPHAGNYENPLQAPEDAIERFGYIRDPKRRTYAGIIAAPTGIIATPAVADIAAPAGIIAAPAGIIAAPAGVIAAPAGITTAPTGILTVPAGIIAAPADIIAAPTGIIATPAAADIATLAGIIAAPTILSDLISKPRLVSSLRSWENSTRSVPLLCLLHHWA